MRKTRLSNASSPLSYVLQGGFGATDFTSGETITGESSGATATVGTLTAGSKVITSNFELDTGQRDNFYDIARIVRKANTNLLLWVDLQSYLISSHMVLEISFL